MRTKRFEGSDVRKILTGMVTDSTVCARISNRWPDAGLFEQQWANLVGGLIVDYFKKYGSPPREAMIGLFQQWAANTMASDEVVKAVENFLQTTSDENHNEPPDYLLDLAGRHFNRVKLEQTIGMVKNELAENRVEDAERLIDAHRRVNLGVGSFDPVLEEANYWTDLDDPERARPMVYYRGDLGDFFGDSFQRGRLFAFLAPDKAGKSRWLIDFAYRALRSKLRVVFFECGDSTRDDFLQRLKCRATGQPETNRMLALPTGWDENGKLQVDERMCDGADGMDAFRELRRLSKPGAFRLAVHHSGSISAPDIQGILDAWDTEDDWRPDVVCIDYADILAPPKFIKDPLEQIDETWKTLRRISQKHHCLVMTATQSDASIYGREHTLLGKKNFSGRKTKNAHVNGMIGINVTPEENEMGVTRINWVARRKGRSNEKAFVLVAGCQDVENPAMISRKYRSADSSPKTDKKAGI